MSIAPLVLRAATDIKANPAPDAYFSGPVQMEVLARPDSFACETLRVNFPPGGRTGWHTHPVGQILIVIAGQGIVATRDGARRMSVGDVVEILADVEHWHGASRDTPMTHVAVQPGGATQWLELVDDADYIRLCERAAP